MVGDAYGYVYPVINEVICVNCGLCSISCPNNSNIVYNTPLTAFVAIARDSEEQLSSTSGGLASVFTRLFVRQGGIVYGCSGYDCWHIRHIRIDKESDIPLLKGSKYIQSDVGLAYRSVKADLKDSRKVLFIGTPCQISGLKAFLKKDYCNLFTIDFICHGVPSQQLLNEALLSNNNVQKKNQYSVAFRKKNKRGNCQFGIYLRDSNGRYVIDESFPKNHYITGYLLGLFYRDNCYTCKYARKERVSEITLGDYWDNEDRYKEMANSHCGLSMLMVNNRQGESLLRMASDYILYKSVLFEEIVLNHEQLSHPFRAHENKNLFRNEYISRNYYTAIRNSLHGFYKQRRLVGIKSFIKKLPGVNALYRQFAAK